jgi:hypothetical protein
MALTTNSYLRYKNNVNIEPLFENSELILLDFESYFDKYYNTLFNDEMMLYYSNSEFNQFVSSYDTLIQTFISKYYNHDDLTNINSWFISYSNKCKYNAIFQHIKIKLIPIYVSDYINNNTKLFVNHFLEELESLYGNNKKLTYKNSIPLNKIHFSLYRNIICIICTFYVQIYFNICNEDVLNNILRVLMEDYLQGIAFSKYEMIQDIQKDIFTPLNMENLFYESYLEFMDDLQIKTIVMSNTFKINNLIISDKINYFIFKNLISRFNNEVLLHNLEYLMSKAINQEIHKIIENGKSYIIQRVYDDYLID